MLVLQETAAGQNFCRSGFSSSLLRVSCNPQSFLLLFIGLFFLIRLLYMITPASEAALAHRCSHFYSRTGWNSPSCPSPNWHKSVSLTMPPPTDFRLHLLVQETVKNCYNKPLRKHTNKQKTTVKC